jgi:hypothetical protein
MEEDASMIARPGTDQGEEYKIFPLTSLGLNNSYDFQIRVPFDGLGVTPGGRVEVTVILPRFDGYESQLVETEKSLQFSSYHCWLLLREEVAVEAYRAALYILHKGLEGSDHVSDGTLIRAKNENRCPQFPLRMFLMLPLLKNFIFSKF